MQKILLVFDESNIEGEYYNDLIGVCSTIEEANILVGDINAQSKPYKEHRGYVLEVYYGWRA